MKNIKKESLVVITSYPPKGQIHGNGVVGIAPFSKYTLLAMKKVAKNLGITVLAENLSQESRIKNQELEKKENHNSYTDAGISVKRVWKRNSLATFWNLFWEIYNNHKTDKKIMIQCELAMFGGIAHLLPLPFFLLALKLLRKDIYFVYHQVIPDMNALYGHLNLSPDSLKVQLYTMGIRLFYRVTLLMATKAFVFDEVLKDRLKKYGNKNKIAVIPLGVDTVEKLPTKREARRLLQIPQNVFTVVCFGFLAWYKGTDWVIEALHAANAGRAKKKIHLVLAGGPNPNHLDKPFYKEYIRRVEKRCAENGFTVSGFVKEHDIPAYYQAADLLIFPYRTLMSSSGPLALAFAYKKPFLISEALKGLLRTSDIDKLISKQSLTREDLYFGANGDLARKIKTYMKSPTLAAKITALSGKTARVRNWDYIGEQYYGEIFI